jgi:ketosteroid isomerase-like protein
MDRDEAIELLDRLHEAQNAYYGGDSRSGLESLLAPDIVWSVPGASPIAGTYRGHREVFAYFDRRRSLAAGTFRMIRRDVLTGAGDRIAALTDGVATIGGAERRWSTVGLYDIAGSQIAACRLLPLDPVAFDAIWTP